MKIKFFIIIIIVLAISYVGINYARHESAQNNSMVTNRDVTEISHLILGKGEICPIYAPKGEIVYNSEWTGELPAIDKVRKTYKTATFGLG